MAGKAGSKAKETSMDRRRFLATFVVCLALAGPALAGGDWNGFFGGVDPKLMQYKPIDTSKAIAPMPTPSRMTLSGVLSKFHYPGYSVRTIPSVPIPAKGTVIAPPLQTQFQPVMPIPAKKRS
jgi:hypothetical protein